MSSKYRLPSTSETNSQKAVKPNTYDRAVSGPAAPVGLVRRQASRVPSGTLSAADYGTTLDLSIPWCPTYAGLRIEDLAPPAPALVRLPQGGLGLNFMRQIPDIGGVNPGDAACAVATFHASVTYVSQAMTNPAADAQLAGGMTRLPATAANEILSFACQKIGAERQTDFVFTSPPLKAVWTPVGTGYAASLVLNVHAQAAIDDVCGKNVTIVDLRRHTLVPGLSGPIFLASYMDDSSKNYLTSATAVSRQSVPTATATASALVSSHGISLSGGPTINTLLTVGPVVGDAMAVASMSLFGLGALALIAHRIVAGRRTAAPEQAV